MTEALLDAPVASERSASEIEEENRQQFWAPDLREKRLNELEVADIESEAEGTERPDGWNPKLNRERAVAREERQAQEAARIEEGRSLTSEEEEEIRGRLHRQLEVLRRLAPSSLEAHAKLLHRGDSNKPIEAATHHAEWIHILEDRERFPWVVVVAPPGFAKSTWFSWIYPTWRLGVTQGRARLGIVGNAGAQAGAWVSAIGESLDSPGFRSAYPQASAHPDKRRGWSKNSFYLKGTPSGNNPAALASGIGGVSVLGKRFDEIVLDDPTTWDNARSKTVMDGQRAWLKTTLLSRFPPGMGPPEGEGGRMVVVCTRWSEDDLVPTLEEQGFVVVRMPSLGFTDRVITCPTCGYEGMVTDLDGQVLHPDNRCATPNALLDVVEYGERSLWPERISEAQLLEQWMQDPLVFELIMQGDASALAGDFFDPAWFQRAPLPERHNFEKVVQFVDTAAGKDRRKGDYFVIVTLGKCKGKYWVMDVLRKRLSTLKQKDAVISAAEKWNPDRIAVEDKNEGIALVQQLAADARLPVKPYTPVKDKEFRATPVAGAYRQGLVVHPVNKAGISERWVKSLESEMEAFPESTHDDQVDALSGAFNTLALGGARIRVLG